MDKITQIIIKSLNETAQIYADTQISADENTTIFGNGGVLDSLGLVALISEIESEISANFGVNIILATEKAMSMRNSPFLNVKSLSKFTKECIDENSSN